MSQKVTGVWINYFKNSGYVRLFEEKLKQGVDSFLVASSGFPVMGIHFQGLTSAGDNIILLYPNFIGRRDMNEPKPHDPLWRR